MTLKQLGLHIFINCTFVLISIICPKDYVKVIVAAHIGYNVGAVTMLSTSD